MTVEEICRLLSTGWVDSRDIPELQDDSIRGDVSHRAEGVGQRLFYSPTTDSYGLVLDGELPETASHRAAVRLDRAHRALIAACWMHLRWLPAERQRITEQTGQALTQEQPSLTIDDLAQQFKGHLKKSYMEEMLLPHLKHLGYLEQREGKLYPGPMLDSLDEMKASERAREYMIRFKRMAYLKRRAEEIDRVRQAAEKTSDA